MKSNVPIFYLTCYENTFLTSRRDATDNILVTLLKSRNGSVTKCDMICILTSQFEVIIWRDLMYSGWKESSVEVFQQEEITRKEKCLCWTLSLFLDANIRHCKRFYLLSFHFKLTSYNWILLFQLHRRETFYIFIFRYVTFSNVTSVTITRVTSVTSQRDVSNVTKMCHGNLLSR